jgi:hypothetical protein
MEFQTLPALEAEHMRKVDEINLRYLELSKESTEEKDKLVAQARRPLEQELATAEAAFKKALVPAKSRRAQRERHAVAQLAMSLQHPRGVHGEAWARRAYKNRLDRAERKYSEDIFDINEEHGFRKQDMHLLIMAAGSGHTHAWRDAMEIHNKAHTKELAILAAEFAAARARLESRSDSSRKRRVASDDEEDTPCAYEGVPLPSSKAIELQ